LVTVLLNKGYGSGWTSVNTQAAGAADAGFLVEIY
jgi:hypothetical protein